MSPNDVSGVLVHGALAGGSSWSRTIGPLVAGDVGAVAALDEFYGAEPHPPAPKLAPDAHGLICLPDAAFAATFAQNAAAEERAVDRPSWFLVAEQPPSDRSKRVLRPRR